MNLPLVQSLRRWLAIRSCPTEQQLAAYADRQLIGQERHTVEHHMSDCRNCAEQIAFLARAGSVEADNVPAELVRKANALGTIAQHYPVPTWSLVALGTAAVLLLAISTIQAPREVQTARTSPPVLASLPTAQQNGAIKDAGSKMELRGREDGQSSLFIYPAPGQLMDKVSPVIRWSTSDLAKSYEIELLTDSGNLLWSSHVSSTSVALPPSIRLVSGQTYYLRISIHQKDGAVQRNKAVPFVAG